MKVVNFRVEDEKIILTVIDEEGESKDCDFPLDVFKELLVVAPPTEEKQIRELIQEILDVKKKRILFIDKLLGEYQKLIDKLQDGEDGVKTAQSKVDVAKWKVYLDGVSKEKAMLQEIRHLIKLTYQEEGELRARLMRLQTGKR